DQYDAATCRDSVQRVRLLGGVCGGVAAGGPGATHLAGQDSGRTPPAGAQPVKAESPKRLPTLNRLLLQSHLGLTLALVAVALLIGGWALRAALLDQATAQVEIAAINALRQLDDNRRELTVVARLLGERPTLTRLLWQRRINAEN